MRPWPTVHPVATEAPTPSPSASGEALQEGGRARSAEPDRSVPPGRQPAAGQDAQHEQDVPRGEGLPREGGQQARRARHDGEAEVAAGRRGNRPGDRGHHPDPQARLAPRPRAGAAIAQPRQTDEQEDAGAEGGGRRRAPRDGGNRFLQRGANAVQRTRVGGQRTQRHPEHGQQRPDVACAQLVPDPRRAASRPAHRSAEEDAARDCGQDFQRQFGRPGEPSREDGREQHELNCHGEDQRLDLRPLAVEDAAQAGAHAERPSLRAVPERHPDRQGAEHAERAHGASPTATGRPWARHSATPSPRAMAR